MKEVEGEVAVDAEVNGEWTRRPSHSRTRSTPAGRRNQAVNERDPLLRRRRSFDENEAGYVPEAESFAGGTILGIHNLAIVFPQFIV